MRAYDHYKKPNKPVIITIFIWFEILGTIYVVIGTLIKMFEGG